MKNRGYLWALLPGLVVAAVHAALWRSRLPDRVATHFGIDGTPNTWMSRDDALLAYLGAIAAFTAIFALVLLLIDKLPNSMINIPNRKYWLAPERRPETVERVGKYMVAFVGLMSAFLILIFHCTFSAALTESKKLSLAGVWPILVLFLAVVIGWLGSFYRAFQLPPGRGDETRVS